jgi:hypothetical protein
MLSRSAISAVSSHCEEHAGAIVDSEGLRDQYGEVDWAANVEADKAAAARDSMSTGLGC